MEVTSATFTPAHSSAVDYSVRELIDEYNRFTSANEDERLAKITEFVHRFLCIHPFRGGNGRVSRALVTRLLRHAGMLPSGISVHYY